MGKTEKYEKAVFTNICMVYDDNGNVLVQNRVDPRWSGITLPGGHAERCEPFVNSVIREVKEETGLDIKNPVLCGVKQFQTDEDARYVVFLYKTNEFSGEIKSSEEGEIFWMKRDEIFKHKTTDDLDAIFEVIENSKLNEFFYDRTDGGWKRVLY